MAEVLDKKPSTKGKPEQPKMYVVVLLNDDYTPMDFVVALLVTVFRKSVEEATSLMLDIHKDGKAVCGGPWSLEIAETKVMEVISAAVRAGHPLMAKAEEA